MSRLKAVWNALFGERAKEPSLPTTVYGDVFSRWMTESGRSSGHPKIEQCVAEKLGTTDRYAVELRHYRGSSAGIHLTHSTALRDEATLAQAIEAIEQHSQRLLPAFKRDSYPTLPASTVRTVAAEHGISYDGVHKPITNSATPN